MFKLRSSVPCLVASLVLAGLLLAPATAGAYCIYNLTNVNLHICGGHCASCLAKTIEPGQHSCCPGGDRGCNDAKTVSFSIIYGHHWYDDACNGWDINHAVDDHGWVVLSGKCATDKKNCGCDACSVTYVYHDKNGKITHQGKAAYTSGSGCSYY